jgi:hypothetical protein
LYVSDEHCHCRNSEEACCCQEWQMVKDDFAEIPTLARSVDSLKKDIETKINVFFFFFFFIGLGLGINQSLLE